jgi:hypothetical protein
MADEPPRQKPVAVLIQELGSPDFKIREAATKAIETFGPNALPALLKAKEHSDPEVRSRIAAMDWIRRFQFTELMTPKRITLNLRQKPLSAAIDEIARQTGYSLEVENTFDAALKTGDFQIRNATFWEALDKLCLKGGLLPNPDSSNRFSLLAGRKITPYIAYDGPFRVALESIKFLPEGSQRQSIWFSTKPEQTSWPICTISVSKNQDMEGSLCLSCSVYVEPRLTTLWIGEPRLSKAVDDRNRSVLPEENALKEKVRRVAMRHSSSRALDSYRIRDEIGFLLKDDPYATASCLALPHLNASALKLARGVIPVCIEKGQSTFVVNANQAQGKQFTLDNDSLRIMRFITKKNGECELTYSATARDHNDLDPRTERFELQDAEGKAYERRGASSSGSGSIDEFEYRFVPPPGVVVPPSKLVCIRAVPLVYEVPFEFKNVSLK